MVGHRTGWPRTAPGVWGCARGGGNDALWLAPVGIEVQTPVFEGPFDLLLHLILREQVDLYEVSLAAIVDAYLLELDRLSELDLDGATEFLLIAATLVELKARRLLPGDADPDLDDELGRWEERDLLLARLVECKTFKDAAQSFLALSDAASLSVARRSGPEDHFLGLMPDLLEGVTTSDLAVAMVRAMTPRPTPVVDIGHIHMARASVSEAVEELADELPRAGRMTFRTLTSSLVERLEVVVRFLALLELFKQGLVELVQQETHGDIEIVWTGPTDGGAAVDLVDVYDG
jgi:segregation and condensation protein A